MLYMLIRGDDNGQNFLVKAGMDATSAEAMFQRLRTGHKQWYTVCEASGSQTATDPAMEFAAIIPIRRAR